MNAFNYCTFRFSSSRFSHLKLCLRASPTYSVTENSDVTTVARRLNYSIIAASAVRHSFTLIKATHAHGDTQHAQNS